MGVSVIVHDVHGCLFRGRTATVDPGGTRDEIRLLVRVGALVPGHQPASPEILSVAGQHPVYFLVAGILVPGEVPGPLIIHLAVHVRLFLSEQLIERLTGLLFRGRRAMPDGGRPPLRRNHSPVERVVSGVAVQRVGRIQNLIVRQVSRLRPPLLGHLLLLHLL
jgi:hypothetical protein